MDQFKGAEHWQVPAWQFEARTSIDWPFHALTSFLGKELTLALDDIVLDNPLRAAARATQIYQSYCSKVSEEISNDLIGTREVMSLLGQAMTTKMSELDDVALLPPQTVFSVQASGLG